MFSLAYLRLFTLARSFNTSFFSSPQIIVQGGAFTKLSWPEGELTNAIKESPKKGYEVLTVGFS